MTIDLWSTSLVGVEEDFTVDELDSLRDVGARTIVDPTAQSRGEQEPPQRARER